MADYVCSVVPPYIFEAMSGSSDPQLRETGVSTLGTTRDYCKERHEHFKGKKHHHQHSAAQKSASQSSETAQGVVPPYLHEGVSKSKSADEATKKSAEDTLAISQQIRAERTTGTDVKEAITAS